MPAQPYNGDLFSEVRALKEEVKELRRKTVPGQYTGITEERQRFWTFIDKQDRYIVAEDATTGYGLAAPLMTQTLSDWSLANNYGYKTLPEGTANNTWTYQFFGYLPNVNPYLAMSIYFDIPAGCAMAYRVKSNNDRILLESDYFYGPFSKWHNTPGLRYQLAAPGSVSFIVLEFKQIAIPGPPLISPAYNMGGIYGMKS